jgi:hypothetical protein
MIRPSKAAPIRDRHERARRVEQCVADFAPALRNTISEIELIIYMLLYSKYSVNGSNARLPEGYRLAEIDGSSM